jgi:opacity protein-like surface antigen
MFQNPAMLTTIGGLQISLGGLFQSNERRQEQQYAPVRYYPNLSLLLEGLADDLPDPDPDLFGFTPADSVQRTFDGLGPNWTHSNQRTAPLQAFVAMPFELGAMRLTAGLGVAEYGDFGYFYQNNNVLTPNIFSQRPVPLPRPTDNNPLQADWYQTIRSREGAVMGYGGALAVVWPRFNASFGLSGTLVSGSTDDVEQDIARGRLTFLANEFRADSVYSRTTRTGQSDFSGFDLAFSAIVRGDFVSAGITVRPPLTITRSYSMQVVTDTGTASTTSISGEDEMTLPWRGTAGLTVEPRDNLVFGLEYELRPYARADFADASGAESRPWMSSSVFRVGVDVAVLPWLSLRGGMRRQAETFGADGRAIEDQPVWFTTYSAGAGLTFAGVRMNLAYEGSGSVYQDVMGSAIYHNRSDRHAVVADIAYTLNWNR